MIVFATLVALCTLLPATLANSAEGSRNGREIPDSARKKPVFPDEFTDLDAEASVAGDWDPEVTNRLERARKRYLRALALVEQHDTSAAALQFESAIAMLNDLASFPRIEENLDFTDLVQAVIEDYETYVPNINSLDENSSVFLLRDRLFEEIEASRPSVETIVVSRPDPPSVMPETTIPLTYNPIVQKNIEFFTTAIGRRFMKKSLERTGRWFDFLKKVAKEENMPEEIVHLAVIESGLNPNAFSRARAVGMWQFMQPTGEEYNLGVTYWMDERRDPDKSTRAAMRFLKDLYNDLGDWHLALAAYNCGAGGVRRAIRKSGLEKPDFWQIDEFLPRETRNYVPRFIATSLISMNREQYGFGDDSLTFLQPYLYETCLINEPVTINALAACAGVSTDSLRALNPELVRGCTPPSKSYALKLYPGTSETFRKRFAMLTETDKRPWMNHVVARGETLASIARRYSVSPGEIAEVNNIVGYRTKLRRGSTLRIPVASRASDITESRNEQPTTRTNSDVLPMGSNGQTKRVVTTDTTLAERNSQQTTAPVVSGNSKVAHVIRSGESLSSISRRYGVRIADLRNWNNIPYDNENIHPGDTLVVGITDTPTQSKVPVDRIAVSRAIKHTVLKGETLTELAKSYEIDLAQLRSLNKLKATSTLKAGQILVVETSVSKNKIAEIQSPPPARREARITVPRTYKVRRGDTLAEIAERFELSVDEIRAKNPSLRRSTTVKVGQTIKLQ